MRKNIQLEGLDLTRCDSPVAKFCQVPTHDHGFIGHPFSLLW
jgi:hypothetical protein